MDSKTLNFEYSPRLYDLQVNWPQRLSREKDFFEGIFRGNKVEKILDIGCGTGHHAQLFSTLAQEVIAIDPSQEMIEYARDNVVTSPRVKLLKAGFEDLDNLIHEQLGLVTCLGNTLPILGNKRKIKLALKSTRRILKKDGLAIFQFLNFEPAMIEKNRFYPPKIFSLDNERYLFLKHFEFGKVNTRADFIIIPLSGSGEIKDFIGHTTRLCTLRADLFLKMGYNAGFKNIELLASGGKETFHKARHISLYAILSR